MSCAGRSRRRDEYRRSSRSTTRASLALQRFPVPRGAIAAAIDRLTDAGAKVLAIDLLLLDREPGAEGDALSSGDSVPGCRPGAAMVIRSWRPPKRRTCRSDSDLVKRNTFVSLDRDRHAVGTADGSGRFLAADCGVRAERIIGARQPDARCRPCSPAHGAGDAGRNVGLPAGDAAGSRPAIAGPAAGGDAAGLGRKRHAWPPGDCDRQTESFRSQSLRRSAAQFRPIRWSMSSKARFRQTRSPAEWSSSA